jgi:hypothetical protein
VTRECHAGIRGSRGLRCPRLPARGLPGRVCLAPDGAAGPARGLVPPLDPLEQRRPSARDGSVRLRCGGRVGRALATVLIGRSLLDPGVWWLSRLACKGWPVPTRSWELRLLRGCDRRGPRNLMRGTDVACAVARGDSAAASPRCARVSSVPEPGRTVAMMACALAVAVAVMDRPMLCGSPHCPGTRRIWAACRLHPCFGQFVAAADARVWRARRWRIRSAPPSPRNASAMPAAAPMPASPQSKPWLGARTRTIVVAGLAVLGVVGCWSGFGWTGGLGAGRGLVGFGGGVVICWSGLGRTTGLAPVVLAAAAGAAIALSVSTSVAVVLIWCLERISRASWSCRAPCAIGSARTVLCTGEEPAGVGWSSAKVCD